MSKYIKKHIKKILALLLTFLILLGLFSNYSYIIYSPGPTLDVLGKIDQSTYLVGIDGKDRKAYSGQLHLTTVSQEGGPGRYLSGLRLLSAFFDDEEEIKSLEEVYPSNVTREEIDNFNKSQMSLSQQNALVAALNQIGKPPVTDVNISGVDKSSSFYGKAQKGDKILSLETSQKKVLATNSKDFYDLLAQTPKGTSIKMQVKRNNEIVTLEGKTLPASVDSVNGTKGSRLGIYLDAKYEFPEKVKFAIKDIGGPSAGLMFSLSIMNILSNEDFIGNNKIAGTGTISPNGVVGPIGGVRFKILGTKHQNIKWFLLPEYNCKEALEKPVDGVRLIPVGDLGQAKEVVTSIKSGKTDNLPKCETIVKK